MENEIIRLLVLGVAIFGLGGANAYLLARGLPQVGMACTAFWQLLMQIVEPLRNAFNRGTPLAKALERHGIDPVIADKIAELGADIIVTIAKPYLPEEAPPSGG
jgi:hypothetical protein